MSEVLSVPLLLVGLFLIGLLVNGIVVLVAFNLFFIFREWWFLKEKVLTK